MKNKIMILIMLMLTLQIVDAEYQPFETEIEVKITEGNCEIETEEKVYSYACTGTSTHDIDIDFLRNVSCFYGETLEENQEFLRVLSGGLNDSRKYYDKYLACYGDYTACSIRLSQQNITPPTFSENYLEKYQTEYEKYQSCNSEKISVVTARQTAESKLSTCENEKKDVEDGLLMYAIVGAIVGGGGGYWIWGKKKSPAVSSAEAQLPKSR